MDVEVLLLFCRTSKMSRAMNGMSKQKKVA
jgi:hypothetical protein